VRGCVRNLAKTSGRTFSSCIFLLRLVEEPAGRRA
jgi:hypothetical protein